MSEISKTLAKNLVSIRKSRDISQELLSQLSSVPRTTIASIERNESNPTLNSIHKIATALQIRIDELLSAKRAPVQYYAYTQLKFKKLKGGAVKIAKLLPDSLESIDFERLELDPDFSKVGVPHLPRTKEYFHCIRGKFKISISGEVFSLNEGDLLCFSGDQKHSYMNPGKQKAVGLSVVIFE